MRARPIGAVALCLAACAGGPSAETAGLSDAGGQRAETGAVDADAGPGALDAGPTGADAAVPNPLAPESPCELPSAADTPDPPPADYATAMAQFVARIGAYAACRKPGFLVFPQNAPELAHLDGYLDAVAGIGKEDVYFGAEADAVATDPEETAAWEADLDRFVAAGRLVLTIDYPFTDPDVPAYDAATRDRIDTVYSRSTARGYVPYVAVRNVGAVTEAPGHAPPGHAAPVTRPADVRSWMALLQPPADLSRTDYVTRLAGLSYDLQVIDAEYDGETLTEAELAAIHTGSGALVVSYLSIGEAETYRAYWQAAWDANGDGRPDAAAPAWLADSNPDWPDNYKVRYWMPAWQRLVLTRVDALIDAGFDGAYLDIVDAYECFADEECGP